jgi:RimJ/RimL family protein N-acetyltransferase
MRINEFTAVGFKNVLFVPYCSHHVPMYANWMDDADLRRLTASDHLTLDQERANQRSWRADRDKLTFITFLVPPGLSFDHDAAVISAAASASASAAAAAESALVPLGDINLFVASDVDGQGGGREGDLVGEINLMIADPSMRAQGLGSAVLHGFMAWIKHRQRDLAAEFAGRLEPHDDDDVPTLRWLMAKIDADNLSSLRLFERCGFQRVGSVNVFGEVQVRLSLDELCPPPGRVTEMKYEPRALEMMQ